MHHENEKMALFEALYREYLVPLKKYAYRIGVGYDDIEDMVHEAFIEYYKRYSLDLDHKVKLRDYEPSFGRGDRNSASGSGGYR